MQLVVNVYHATASFPNKEIYGLTGQIRRAAVSIPSNVAEGAARKSKKEFLQFLRISQGSLSELDTQIEMAKRLGFLSEEDWSVLDQIMERIDKMLSGSIRHQKTSHPLRLTLHENSSATPKDKGGR
jgi:four helix bundle protein